jgi:hypothetical protein
LWLRPNTAHSSPPAASRPTSDKFYKTWVTLSHRLQSSATTRSLSVSPPTAST